MVQRVFYNPTTFLGSPATSTSKIRAGAPNDAALLQVVVVQGGHHTGAGRGPTWDQWVDDLQGKIKKPETIAFPMKNGIFLWFFPLNQSIEWSSSMEFGWLIGKSTKKTWNISENPGNLFGWWGKTSMKTHECEHEWNLEGSFAAMKPLLFEKLEKAREWLWVECRWETGSS